MPFHCIGNGVVPKVLSESHSQDKRWNHWERKLRGCKPRVARAAWLPYGWRLLETGPSEIHQAKKQIETVLEHH